MAASTEPTGLGAPARREPRLGLEPGDLLDGRYRLVRAVPHPSDEPVPAVVWQATDEVLARPVAVKVLATSGRGAKSAAAAFLAAAGRAGALSHPGLARVYDAALAVRPAARGRAVEVPYVVSEWVTGRTLAELLADDGPLEPGDAVRLTMQAGEAVAFAHAQGVAHGRLHPGNLMVAADGRLRVTDTAVAAALHGEVAPGAGAGAAPAAAAVEADTRDLGAALYAMLTARWPTSGTAQPSAGVPAAPRASGGVLVYSPRQVRAGIPRPLDLLVVRVLEPRRTPARPAVATPLSLVQALDEVELRPAGTPAPRPPAPPRAGPSRLRRSLPLLGSLGFLALVGVVFYQAGQQVGQLPPRQGALAELVEPSARPGAAGDVIDLASPPIVVRDFDPGSRDGTEQRGSVPNAYDGDSSTAWSTDGYRTPAFSGLKPGVGLLVDLGRPTALQSVKVGLTAGGADVELRAAAAPGRTAADYTLRARQPGSRQVALLEPSTVTPARFWLVWLTKLPRADDGRFRVGVAELVFTRAR